jgi:uncharacterized protein YndB with AHSA1/START domain
MTDPQARNGLLGSISAIGDGRGVVRMEDLFDTTADDLWSALTTPDRLARWIGEVSGDLRLGGTIQARFTSGWEGPGRVEVCRRPERLLLVMMPGTDDETRIEATLTAVGDRTRLVIEERGIPLEHLPGHGSGWQAHVEDLGAHLEGRERQDWRTRWIELTPSYEAFRGGLQ